ncbi:MAG: DUF2309 domain-containing protein [Haloferacaceae archaeon]
MTRDHDSIEERIARAAEAVGPAWPLHSFVTANPLSGFEDEPFHRAVAAGAERFGGRGYPDASVFRRAWAEGRIDRDALQAELRAHGVERDPEALLDELAAAEATGDRAEHDRPDDDATARLDRVFTKWLAAFLDEGEATWPMPNREAGFYAAWRSLAPYDDEIPGCDSPADLPEEPVDAVVDAVSACPQSEWEAIFEAQFAALPGWTGYVRQRADGEANPSADPWQATAPISLTDYLAVRLTLADLMGVPVEPDGDGGSAVAAAPPGPTVETDDGEVVPLAELWLAAWEKSYRRRLLESIDRSVATGTIPDGAAPTGADESEPAAQLVFCIDTRSEVVRRHVERAGPYETHGYAGFFGVPVRYRGYGDEVAVDACPPIVDPQHHVEERLDARNQDAAATHGVLSSLREAGREHLEALKTNVAAAFTFVEGAGSAYGAAMAARTLFPSRVYDALDALDSATPSPAAFSAPGLDRGDGDVGGAGDAHGHGHGADPAGALPRGMTLGERVAYAETAFELMGWESFARLVVFVGHASQTANNPFGSSLDCGACAGNPGGPNARVLAAICNDEDVRAALRERGHDVPAETVFVAAEHNTTTDEITLYDDAVPESHEADLDSLRADLETAREGAAAERVGSGGSAATTDSRGDSAAAVRDTERRAADWAETRPEWGLAGNAAFVIGRRDLTADVGLDGRAFLHSYDWSTDPEGEALEAIFTGPLVVTQWINSQYYFATVDNAVYGSGSKVTQNPVGNLGVYQGNGGDLQTGLPRQSVYADHERPRHQPLRLTAVVEAPVERVGAVLRRHDEVARLFDNGWLRLTVLDPERDAVAHYRGDGEWDRPTDVEAEPLVA